MRRLYIILSFFTALLILMTGCNGDVFINHKPSESVLHLDGNGDSATISLTSSNWNLNMTEVPFPLTNTFYKIYNKDSINITSSGKAVFSAFGHEELNNNLIDLKIERRSSKSLSVIVYENRMITDLILRLHVGSDYDEEVIEVIISPCDRYVFDKIEYSLDNFDYSDSYEISNSVIADNITSSPMTIILFPYENQFNEIEFEPFTEDSYCLLMNQTMNIPTCLDGGKLVMNGECVEYDVGKQILANPFVGTEVKISVPTNIKKKISSWVKHLFVETRYTIQAHNPKNGRVRLFTGKLKMNSLADYVITSENVE